MFFLDEAAYEKFPVVEAPLFQVDVIDKLSFTAQVQSPGNYYLILDNSKNIESTKVSLKVSAARGSADFPEDLTGNTEMQPDDNLPGIHLTKINQELSIL